MPLLPRLWSRADAARDEVPIRAELYSVEAVRNRSKLDETSRTECERRAKPHFSTVHFIGQIIRLIFRLGSLQYSTLLRLIVS